jgi:hypothetical protein
MLLGALVWSFALSSTIEGSGPNAVLSIGNLSLPLRVLLVSFSLVGILMNVLIVVVALSLYNKVVNSQLSSIYLARHQSRYQYLLSYFTVILLIVLMATSGYWYLYLKAGFSTPFLFYSYSSMVLEGFSLTVVFAFITHFSRLKLISIPLLVLILYVLPVMLRISGGFAGNYPIFGELIYFIENIVAFNVNFSAFRENIITKEFIQKELFYPGALITVALLGLNAVLFSRKDLNNDI